MSKVTKLREAALSTMSNDELQNKARNYILCGSEYDGPLVHELLYRWGMQKMAHQVDHTKLVRLQRDGCLPNPELQNRDRLAKALGRLRNELELSDPRLPIRD